MSLLERMSQFAPGSEDVRSGMYQLVEGRVFTLSSTPDGATRRGEVTIDHLRSISGVDEPRDGWYDGRGDYVGQSPPGRAS
jgi:hypothetical protein